MSLVKFQLPPKNVLSPNGANDPLKYYYVPLVGRLYVNRINIALKLLQDRHFTDTLEIGYGSGVLIPTLCKISNQVYGVDLGSNSDSVAKQLQALGCYPNLSHGSDNKLLFEDNSFDLVVAISVLEHVKHIKPFLAEIHRVLKPGGVLLAGMPAVNKTMGYLFQAIGFSGIDDHHVTTPEDMLKAAKLMFKIKAVSWMPRFFPSSIYLYKAFCLEK